MPRSLKFFKNTCPHCHQTAGIPLLGDLVYGEFLYQTEDGDSYAWVSAIGHPAWEKIAEIFEDTAGLTLDRNDEDLRIYHNVMLLTADRYEDQNYTTEFPLCSACGAKIEHYNDREVLCEQDVGDITWNDFLSLTKADQQTKILSLIEQES